MGAPRHAVVLFVPSQYLAECNGSSVLSASLCPRSGPLAARRPRGMLGAFARGRRAWRPRTSRRARRRSAGGGSRRWGRARRRRSSFPRHPAPGRAPLLRLAPRRLGGLSSCALRALGSQPSHLRASLHLWLEQEASSVRNGRAPCSANGATHGRLARCPQKRMEKTPLHLGLSFPL